MASLLDDIVDAPSAPTGPTRLAAPAPTGLTGPIPAPGSAAGRCVLFLHAHPDDEAIFTGATMHRLAAAGARVVLVTATAGELGPVLSPLRPGETLAARRRDELERACAALGVARLVLLGHRDSGMSGWDDNRHPDALAAADLPALARRLADLCLAEGAEALVHYDGEGIYGHPDHVAVHRIGAAAADRCGAVAYEATVDRDALGGGWLTGHLVHAAAGRAVGQPGSAVSLLVDAGPADLAAKRAAMAAHATQIPPRALRSRQFAVTYGREWYVRSGQPTSLEPLLAAAPAA